MPSGRRSARRQAVFVLYQQDLLGLSLGAAIERVGDERVDPYARHLLVGVSKQRESIDGLLTKHLTGWSLERLGVLERAILRSAVYELLWEPEVPEPVVIDEAVGLAKRFCSAEAGALINGVLGSVSADGVRGALDAPSVSED